MTGPPEPLRLFDPDREDPGPAPASSTETRTTLSTDPTTLSTDPTTPRSQADDGEGQNLLRNAAEAAKLEMTARDSLDAAVAAARAAGHSWRTLGIATGIPHQTLHRRSQHDGSGRSKEV